MTEYRRTLTTIGAFFLILTVAILLYAVNAISLTLFAPLVLVFFGVWMLISAGVYGVTPQKYTRSAFSTMSLGLLLIAVGGAWYLLSFNWLYSLSLILLVITALILALAVKNK